MPIVPAGVKRSADAPPAQEIPPFLIEYFLLGRTRPGAIERFIQDGGIVTDVWMAFAAHPDQPQRVLVAPARGTNTTDLGYALHRAIVAYRERSGHPDLPNVSPLENFVALTVYFDELVRVLLPLTTWWGQTKLIRLAEKNSAPLHLALTNAVLRSLGQTLGKPESISIQEVRKEDRGDDRRVLDAAPLAALIGVFVIAKERPEEIEEIRGLAPSRVPEDRKKLMDWIQAHAQEIAREWRDELAEGAAAWYLVRDAIPLDIMQPGQPLIERVFLDRQASLASESTCAIKADAAKRLFEVSCRGITWGIIDSGISTDHPAFVDHYTRTRRKGKDANAPLPRRIKKTLDFTKIHLLRNFDLMATGADERSVARRKAAIESIVVALKTLPGRDVEDPAFEALARENLAMIGDQLAKRLPPDWNLVEPLITIVGGTDDDLPSDHGTHVAGILGADWRDANDEVILQGVCPDIDLYDLRVVDRTSVEHTEFAVLSALEYVKFVNARAGTNGPVIHGVNISMSIPHKVRTYGCGATPVCVAADGLVGSGVVVVAAAGNRGWNEMEMGFGNFVSSSITDPGNAREVITVGATHGAKPHVYGVSFFSSRGPTGDGRIKPDLVAPGERIVSSMRGESDGELDGTSQASPFVSGAAAMLMSRHRELIGDPQRVKQVLLDSATDLRRERYFQGHGLVDVLRAMQSI